jgi:hypothetical protein
MTEEEKRYQREFKRKWRLENPEKAKEYEKRSRERTRERRLEYARNYNPGYYAANKDKFTQHNREYYEANKDAIKAQTKLWRENHPKEYNASREYRRDKLFAWWYGEVVPGLKCAHCGIADYDCLNFHHPIMRKPGEKLRRAITTMLYSLNSQEAIEDEMKKCIVLCANCHNLEHARLRKASHEH